MLSQVSIYLRWSQWLLQRVLKDRPHVIVNMDETGVSNVTSSKHGVIISRGRRNVPVESQGAKRARSSKITLLAVTCSSPELQPHLPQVLLPRYKKGGDAPATLKEAWANVGAPLQAWHATPGYNETPIMMKWMTELRRSIHTVSRETWILLVLDCSVVHICQRVLKHAARLGILILLVPARLTWMMQPLDTHIFVNLKRNLRNSIARSEMAAATGEILMPLRIALIGEAVQQCLVHSDWTHVLPRVGLHASLDGLRPLLRNRVDGVDLSPRPPTDEEMNTLTGRRQRDPRRLTRLVVSPAHLIAARPLATLPPGAPHPAAAPSTEAATHAAASPASDRMTGDMRPTWHHTAHLPGLRPDVIARGVRLPRALNVTMEVEASARVGPAAGTRSQTRTGSASTSAWDVSGAPG